MLARNTINAKGHIPAWISSSAPAKIVVVLLLAQPDGLQNR